MGDFVDELKPFAFLLRFQAQEYVPVLTATTGLADEFGFLFHHFGNGFAVSHLRSTHVGLYVKFAFHTFHKNVQVQFTHTRNNGLTRFFVGAHAEGLVFFGQTRQRVGHFFFVSFRFRFHGDRNNRFGERNAFEHNRVFGRANRLTHAGVFNGHGGGNFAGAEFFDFFAFIGHHTHHTAETFGGVFTGEVYRITGFNRTGINTEET